MAEAILCAMLSSVSSLLSKTSETCLVRCGGARKEALEELVEASEVVEDDDGMWAISRVCG